MQFPNPQDAFLNPVKYWSDAVHLQIELARQAADFMLSFNPALSSFKRSAETKKATVPAKARPSAKVVAPAKTAEAPKADVVTLPKPATNRAVPKTKPVAKKLTKAKAISKPKPADKKSAARPTKAPVQKTTQKPSSKTSPKPSGKATPAQKATAAKAAVPKSAPQAASAKI